MMLKVKYLVLSKFSQAFFFLFRQKIEKNANIYIISGSPRSGTTFLAETIASSLDDSFLVWEPLQDSIIMKLGFNFRRPLLENIENNELIRNYLYGLISLKGLNYFNTWMRNAKYWPSLFRAKHKNVIIKFTRGNGIVDFFNQYGVSAIIIIVRNPLAVVASQIQHHDFEFHPITSSNFLIPNEVEDFLSRKNNNLHLRLALTWLNDYNNAKNSSHAVLINYDQYINSHNKDIDGINFKISSNFIEKSSTYNSKTSLHGSYTDKWKKTLSKTQAIEIFTMFEMLGCKEEIVEYFNITI